MGKACSSRHAWFAKTTSDWLLVASGDSLSAQEQAWADIAIRSGLGKVSAGNPSHKALSPFRHSQIK
jgi:hypothetical protein